MSTAGSLGDILGRRLVFAGGLVLFTAASLTCALWIGLVNPPLASVAVGVVEPRMSGMASGISNTFRQVGVATGIAGLGALLQARVTSRVEDALRGVQGIDASRIAHSVATGSTRQAIASAPPHARAAIGHAVRTAFVSGLNEILLIAAIVAFAGAVAGFALVRRRDFVQHGSPAAVRAE